MSKEDEAHPIRELAIIAAKAVIGSMPFGGTATAIFEGTYLLNQQLAKHMERRAEMRSAEFTSSVFAGEVSAKLAEFLTADDYYALLSGCMSDLENEKAKYYGRLTRAIGLGLVPQSLRRFLILALSQISVAQLQMLRRSYVAKIHKLRPDRGEGIVDTISVLKLGADFDTPNYLDYKDLTSKHLYENSTLSMIGAEMVKACFDPSELEPESIGEIAWHPAALDVIFDVGTGQLISDLSEQAWEAGIRCGNRSSHVLDRPHLGVFLSPTVVLVEQVETPDYFQKMKASLKGRKALFVTYHDHDAAIREVYPESQIIHAQGLAHRDVARRVLDLVKQAIEA